MLLPFERKTLNKILTKVTALPDVISTVKTAVDTLAANWTATRAGYLDNIRSYTITNNTGSLTGVLSAKATYIANSLIGAVNNTGGTYNSGSVHAKLATLILNDPTTQFVAGTGITKYNPVNSALGMTTISSDYYSDNIRASSTSEYIRVYVYRKTSYSFTANRDGVVRLTAKAVTSDGIPVYVFVTENGSNYYNSLLSFIASSATTKTADFSVKAGKTYNIFVGKEAIDIKGDVSQIKISYDIVTNSAIL